MTKRGALVVILACWSGCGSGGGGGSGVVEVLGVEPGPAVPDGGASPDTFRVFAFERTTNGGATAPSPERLAISCSGAPCPCSGADTFPGATTGVLAIIVDDSGSNSASPSTCTGCPTDPDDTRVEAVKTLAQTLFARAPTWRVALFDFGVRANGGFKAARLLAGYTSYPEDLVAGADLLYPGASTWIYDSLDDVLPGVSGERAALDAGPVPARVLLVTDGEDTHSVTKLEDVLTRATSLGVTVDAVAYGQADGGTLVLASRAFRDLRRIGEATGGIVTFVPTQSLPALFDRLARAYAGGYATRTCRVPDGAEAVSGNVSLGGEPVSFTFEVAP
ncbi:MAG: VWA domain-containing protein [Myxococcales bacterium]|nr:VWA domain-containing protein [Myxococcales bacterium]